MREDQNATRREFITVAATAAGGLLLAGCTGKEMFYADSRASSRPAGMSPENFSPPEDLMREHGLLRRILLIYSEAIRRLDAAEQISAGVLADSAGIIRDFIEQYHEKLEEDYLFPRFRKANTLSDLIDVLEDQHKAGRRLTDAVIRMVNIESQKTIEGRRAIATAMLQFIRMYYPHAAREDTVLFPAFHLTVSAAEYDELGDAFEDREHELFGDKGFEKMVDRVAGIEKKLGIYDLAQFTPKA